MACETAVVASAVGGIKEVVVPGETGLLVDPQLDAGTFEPTDPAAFSAGLAAAINRLARDPELRARFGRSGRRRVVEQFSWDAIAQRTVDLYRSLLLRPPHAPSVKRLPVVEVTSWSAIRSCAAATKLTPLQCIGMRRSGFSSCRPRTTSAT